MISLNELAMEIVDDMIDYRDELKIKVKKLENKATVIDCGVEVVGGYEAGIMFIQISMGGLSTVDMYIESINDVPLSFIRVHTDFPSLTCLGSQKASWKINVGEYYAIGSGPARALALEPEEIYETLDYEDDAEYAVVTLEAEQLPNEKVIEYIAKKCDVEPGRVYAVVTATKSIVGSVQVAGRVIEVAVNKLYKLGYDINKITAAIGSAPIAPVLGDSFKAMGAVNDSILYYGKVFLNVEEFSKDFDKITFSSCKEYGKTFYEILKEANFDFYKVNPDVFAPAKVTINDLSKGQTYVYGVLNPEIILKSYGISKEV